MPASPQPHHQPSKPNPLKRPYTVSFNGELLSLPKGKCRAPSPSLTEKSQKYATLSSQKHWRPLYSIWRPASCTKAVVMSNQMHTWQTLQIDAKILAIGQIQQQSPIGPLQPTRSEISMNPHRKFVGKEMSSAKNKPFLENLFKKGGAKKNKTPNLWP